MRWIIDRLGPTGAHGAIGLVVVLAVVFIAVYGRVYGPDHDLTETAVEALVLGIGAIICSAANMLRGGSGES